MSQPYGEQTAHFLLVGLIGSSAALVAFSFIWFSNNSDRLLRSSSCILAFTSALSYFATYSGVGILIKHSENPPRDIFWARYLDAFITACTTTVCILHLIKASFVSSASILSHLLLCLLAYSVGALTVSPFKSWWWGSGFAFTLLVTLQLHRELSSARKTAPAVASYASTMATFMFTWALVLSLTWGLGQEGVGVMTRALETCLLVLADLALKVGMFTYILFALETPEGGARQHELEGRLLPSSRFSTECI